MCVVWPVSTNCEANPYLSQGLAFPTVLALQGKTLSLAETPNDSRVVGLRAVHPFRGDPGKRSPRVGIDCHLVHSPTVFVRGEHTHERHALTDRQTRERTHGQDTHPR